MGRGVRIPGGDPAAGDVAWERGHVWVGGEVGEGGVGGGEHGVVSRGGCAGEWDGD